MERKDLTVGQQIAYQSYEGADPTFGTITSLTAEVERKTGYRSYKKFNTGIEVTWESGRTVVLDNAKKLITREQGESAVEYRKALRAAQAREDAAEKSIKAALTNAGMKMGPYSVTCSSWGIKLELTKEAWAVLCAKLELGELGW